MINLFGLGGVFLSSGFVQAQTVVAPTQKSNAVVRSSSKPRVVAMTDRARPIAGNSAGKKYIDPPSLRTNAVSPGVYRWRKDITVTVFWIGEQPTPKNPVPNHMSSWDQAWQVNYGGFDDPDPLQRTRDYRPKAFIPRQNPFYVALPYNDCVGSHGHKEEASRVIPWFQRDFVKPGQSVCKGKWLQIYYKGKYCFAQWEDCGPFNTVDWGYVFGDKSPMNQSNRGAGLDISPAVRDFLGVKSGEKVHWRFVDTYRIPRGPWSKYGDNNPFVKRQPSPIEQRRMIKSQKLNDLKDKAVESRPIQGPAVAPKDVRKLRLELQG